MDWKDLRRRVQKEELRFTILMIVIFFVALAGEILVKNGKTLIYVLDFDSVSLVIIQIQATVQTLSIALLALVTGRSADSYMGVNYNDFSLIFGLAFLNRRE